ncbi:hypothetical protein [Chitinivibrio alkaliphilus]|uniref:Secreted protein n=1 Tax=Chitinivibrio alkaliphilus ACht1 TaxID=1313304 RepID=U7D8Y6_9BACT|nr:hypothetical protein [Chitinivibrio alkaliphilus]ERP38849.1 hypothetical protein CALK_0624 [Chitinivibrio alkaliphilus ACht1]
MKYVVLLCMFALFVSCSSGSLLSPGTGDDSTVSDEWVPERWDDEDNDE